jgi:uncharacterized protein (DUF433 family)
MTILDFSPSEAAAVSGAPLAVIQKAITDRKIPTCAISAGKRRRIDEFALLAFALADAMPAEVRLSPAAAYKLLLCEHPADPTAELTIGDLVRIDAGKALAAARRRLDLYRRARSIVVRDPDILGGEPVIKGTRITARSVLGRIEEGDSIDSLLEDYPYLDREAVEAAALYAKANPPRGRPSGQLWRRAS